MKSTNKLDSVLAMIRGMSEEEQSLLADGILKMLADPSASKTGTCRDLVDVAEHEKPDCPHCAAKASLGWVMKRGFHKGSQRYYCKACGRYFVATTNTAFARSRKDAETWRKFIRLTVAGKSLHACCAECSIAYQTAFTWRHKILNAFVMNQKATKMGGVVEVDEMLVPISYKGNHIKGGFGARKRMPGVDTGLPRASYKRGTDNRSLSSRDKACVFCMVEDGNKGFYAAVPGVGFMTREMLQVTVGEHVDKETAFMLADGYIITQRYFDENGYRYKILSSNTSNNRNHHKPEISGNLHMQHINGMHRHLRLFLSRYCGVSSKYLENYVALYIWLKSVELSKQQRKGAEKASVSRAAIPDCYISRKSIESRPSVPVCA